MSQKPLPEVLDRELTRAAASETIDPICSLLERCINEATNLYARCQLGTVPGHEHQATFGLYYHVVEMIDGVHVLVDRSIVTPAVPLVRSAWEAALQLEFILEQDFVARAIACRVGQAMKRKQYLSELHKTWPQHAAASQLLTEIAQIDLALAAAAFAPAAAAITSPNAWYAACGGGTSIEQLARHLDRNEEYQTLYRHWSAHAHANDTQRMFSVEGGSLVLEPLRSPKGLGSLGKTAIDFLLRSMQLMSSHYRGPGDLSTWYANNVREDFLNLK